MRPLRRSDGGFTLIELVVVIAVIGIITAPLANFVIEYFKTYQTTQNRLSDSHDIQIATAYFSQDVANTGLRAATAPYGLNQSIWTQSPWPSPPSCGQGLGTTKLLLLWDTWDQTTETQLPASAAYVQEGNTLHRIFCQASATDPTGSQTISDATVVHNLVSATPSCFTATGGAAACDSGTPPPKVRLALVIASSGMDSAAPKQPVTLDARRRQS